MLFSDDSCVYIENSLNNLTFKDSIIDDVKLCSSVRNWNEKTKLNLNYDTEQKIICWFSRESVLSKRQIHKATSLRIHRRQQTE